MFVWAYGFSFGTVALHLSTHAPFNESSLTAIGAVGTVALAIEYMIPIGEYTFSIQLVSMPELTTCPHLLRLTLTFPRRSLPSRAQSSSPSSVATPTG
jgi:hypothetical protein